MSESRTSQAVPGQALLGWPPLVALLTILANDFWLRRRHPGLLSGKLSDLAICFVFPIVLVAAWEWLAWAIARWLARPWHGATARARIALTMVAVAYYAGMKLWPAFGGLHRAWLSAMIPGWSFRAGTQDPTDLVALAMVPAALVYMHKRRTGGANART